MNIKLKKFIEACIAKGEAEETGNVKPREDRKYYKIINSVYSYLKNNHQLEELSNLLDHENVYVQLWASSYMLQLSGSKAEKVLENLATLKGNIGFCAEMTLQEWRKGNLKF